jgi:hypothetical protein
MKKQPHTKAADAKPVDKDLQGEGNYDATRRYDNAAHEFAKSGQVESAARKARPGRPDEAAEMKRAERVGLSHSKGEDPTVSPVRPDPQK